MPGKKDSLATQRLKAAQRAQNESGVSDVIPPTCQSENALVRAVWDELAPPLIAARLVNFATMHLFTDICFHLVVLRQMQGDIVDRNNPWFEEVQNYGDGGVALSGVKESGKLKAYRQWSASYRGLLKELSLRPRDMAGLWNLDEKAEDDDDLLS